MEFKISELEREPVVFDLELAPGKIDFGGEAEQMGESRLDPAALLGVGLAALARRSFVSGMDLAFGVATVVIGVAAVLVLAVLPTRGAPNPGSRPS